MLSGFSSLIKISSGKDPEDAGVKEILGKNLYYIAADIYPSIATHIKRMNATSFDEIPQQSPFKCINVDKN